MGRTFAFAAAIAAILITPGATAQAPASASPGALAAAPLRIGSGDLLELSVYDNQDLAGRYRVDDKGDLTVPLLGAVHVEGETAAEAGKTLENRYVEAEILQPGGAQVTVFIAEYATQGILVNGEVKLPGLYPALGVRVLNDLITAAGGETISASSVLTITHRADPGNPVRVEFIPDALPPVIPQVQVFPGDTINVPSAGLVYVLGSVGRSGAYVLEGRHVLTVEKAMALAGGSMHGANMEHAHVVRTLEDGKKEDIVLNVSQIFKGKAPDVALKDGDILYIPTNNTKVILLQALTSAIGVGTTVLTYRAAYQ